MSFRDPPVSTCPALPPPTLGLQVHVAMPSFSVRVWASCSGPHACAAALCQRSLLSRPSEGPRYPHLPLLLFRASCRQDRTQSSCLHASSAALRSADSVHSHFADRRKQHTNASLLFRGSLMLGQPGALLCCLDKGPRTKTSAMPSLHLQPARDVKEIEM